MIYQDDPNFLINNLTIYKNLISLLKERNTFDKIQVYSLVFNISCSKSFMSR